MITLISTENDSCAINLVFEPMESRTKSSNVGVDYVGVVPGIKQSVPFYYDNTGTKEKLVTVTKGQSLEDKGGNIEKGESVYIIIEASKGSRGKVKINLD